MLQYVLYIFLGIAILLVMVVIHELGHYVAGKVLKFKIDEFSVGFGPKLAQKKLRNGELFTLRAVPLGGYCAFTGEDNADGTTIGKREDSFKETAPALENATGERDFLLFDEQKPWKRIIVFVAGPLLNFLSAFFFCFIFILVVGYSLPRVQEVTADNSPLKVGDIIVAVDGRNIGVLDSYAELTQDIKIGEKSFLTVIRDGRKEELSVLVREITTTDEKGNETKKAGYGYTASYESVSGSFSDAFIFAIPLTFKFSWMILGAFGALVTGRVAITSLTGPVGTVSAFADIAMMHWKNVLLWMPLIASNLAIFNILPIPALDGSKIVFTTIEWIRRKPVNKSVENVIHFAGLILLFAFVIVIDIIGMFFRGLG